MVAVTQARIDITYLIIMHLRGENRQPEAFEAFLQYLAFGLHVTFCLLTSIVPAAV